MPDKTIIAMCWSRIHDLVSRLKSNAKSKDVSMVKWGAMEIVKLCETIEEENSNG